MVFLGMGLGRIGFGVALMPFLSDSLGAMLAVALGAWVPVVVGSIALGRFGASRRVPDRIRSTATVLREVGGNSYALLAFFALSNTDVILARIRFDEHEAGLYAGGIILAKAVLFLPQFVVVIVFPSMASSSTQHRMYLRALVVVGTIGALATAGAAVLSDLAVTFIGGDAYQEVEPDIWLFGTVGTLLALVQLMVYEVVARQHRASVAIIWAGLATVAIAGSLVDGMTGLVRAVALVDLGVLFALVLTAVFHPAMQSQEDAGDEPSARR
jgi:O-antigen/teichoic acid export membrane protein